MKREYQGHPICNKCGFIKFDGCCKIAKYPIDIRIQIEREVLDFVLQEKRNQLVGSKRKTDVKSLVRTWLFDQKKNDLLPSNDYYKKLMAIHF